MGDIYYDNLQLLLPMKGANNGTVFTDYSKYRRQIYRAGTTLPVTTTSQKAFTNYNSSGYFTYNSSGTPARLCTNGLSIGTEPFTWSCWMSVNDTAAAQYLFDTRYANEAMSAISNNASGGFGIAYTGEEYGLRFSYGTGPTTIDYASGYDPWYPSQPNPPVISGWAHFEVSRDASNVVRLFANGKLKASGADVTNNFAYSSATIGGAAVAATRGDYYLTDVALYVGVALHTADFTPAVRRKTGYALSGTVLDDTGTGAPRIISAHSRLAPSAASITTSDANGTYSFADLVDDDHFVVFQDDAAGTAYNALILDKVTPA